MLRPFALTQGRAAAVIDLPLDAIVTSTDRARHLAHRMVAERARIVQLCAEPHSIAEIGALIGVHLGVARVLVADLMASEFVELSTADFDDDGPDVSTLERLLDDLQTF